MIECLNRFEHFLHNDKHGLPLLIEAGLVHVQFESIHPFLDGNGRLGRLLITLLLCEKSLLKEPLLYLSLYFKKHRIQYYEYLQRVRTEGAWEEWLKFFLEGTAITAQEAAETATRILRLFSKDRQKIQKLGRSAGSALRVHEYMQRKPIANIAAEAKTLDSHSYGGPESPGANRNRGRSLLEKEGTACSLPPDISISSARGQSPCVAETASGVINPHGAPERIVDSIIFRVLSRPIR